MIAASRPTALAIANRRRAFTLIEVLLALLLSSALLAGLWAALEISMRMFETGRTRVEEAQLARALFNQFDADLQQTILGSSLPPAGEVLAPIALPAGLPGAKPSQPPSLAGILPLSGGKGELPRWNARGAGAGGATASKSRLPGLSGSAYELRVDTCRAVPQGMATARHRSLNAAETLELRSVFYVLARPLPAERAAPGAPANSGEALVRYETTWLASPGELQRGAADQVATAQDRLFEEFLAVEDRYESLQGEAGQTQTPATLHDDFSVSPEIGGLEFRYFDGAEWLSSWDSEAAGRLPAAVEIVLAIRPAEVRRARQPIEVDSDSESKPELPTARLIVHLPLGSAPAPDAASESFARPGIAEPLP